MESARSVVDVLEPAAARLVGEQGVILADARFEQVLGLRVKVRDGTVELVSEGIDQGISVRVFVEGGYGFSIATRVDRESIERAFNEALSMARRMASEPRRPEVKPYLLDAVRDEVVWMPKRDPRDVSIEEKVKDLLELDDMIKSLAEEKRVPLKSRDILLTERIEFKVYVSSEGRVILQERGIDYLRVTAAAREADVAAEAIERVGTTRGYVLFTEKKSMEEVAKTVVERLAKQLRGKPPKAGNFPVVMAPEVIGVFVHEAFGHLTEADLTLAGSVVKDKIGSKVASELVNIVDDPTLDDGFGSYKYDDEGVRAIRATLVENGVLKQLMVDRVYASMLNVEPTGNARAESFRVPPLIRMRNTVMLPGDYRVEELFEGIRFGYYLVSHAGGEANLDGGFQVGVQEAYEIVNGEIGEPVRNLSISGNTLETLFNVDAVARDFQIHYGMCGKGQYVYVSDGGPHVRVKRVAVGGRVF